MPAIKVAVSGAAGRVAYALLPLIAQGSMLGPNVHVELMLLEIEEVLSSLEGVRAELVDCAYPLLDKVVVTADPLVAFRDVEVVILCGSSPRKAGMDRRALLDKNVAIFREHGAALGEAAARDCRILVVGNPANTNALVLLKAAKGKLAPHQVTGMSRLDHNRALAQVAQHANVNVSSVRNAIIWGNHNATMVPDINNCKVGDKTAREAVKDDAFLDGPFIKTVQQRGMEIIDFRGVSSALSAAHAAMECMRDWIHGTPEGVYVSMSVYSNGNPYGFADDLMISFPCTCKNGQWQIVKDLPLTPEQLKNIEISIADLKDERRESGMESVGCHL